MKTDYSLTKISLWQLVEYPSPLWLPFCLFLILISPFIMTLYALYALLYAACFGWAAWDAKMERQRAARYHRNRQIRGQ